jgi:type I restriction enzyme M protein
MNDQQHYTNHSDLIWKIANLLRGPYRPPQYRKVMLPLVVLRRLDCVLHASKKEVLADYEALKAKELSADVIEKTINRKFKLNFHNTSRFTFANLLDDPSKLAANLVNYMAGYSNKARKIIDHFKFAEEIEKLDAANRLFEIIKEEVLPYRSDAWIDHTKTKVGYEIPFNRHFYQYQAPRELAAIEADIEALEASIMAMLQEVV